MPRFAANLTMLFNEVEFLDRFGAAARTGFGGVEYLFPYPYPTEVLAERLHAHALQQVLFNLPAGDWAAGERGIACHPGREREFREGVDVAIAYARALHCPRVNCLAGIAPTGVPAGLLDETLVENLRFAARRLGEAGIQLLVEAINTRDMPGFHVRRTDQALAILDAVGDSNVALQFDAYHMQVMEGDLAVTLERNVARIGHVQIADNPGRHEPGTGEINYPFLFAHLDRIGYRGWVGCEYRPAGTTEAGLGWVGPWRAVD